VFNSHLPIFEGPCLNHICPLTPATSRFIGFGGPSSYRASQFITAWAQREIDGVGGKCLETVEGMSILQGNIWKHTMWKAYGVMLCRCLKPSLDWNWRSTRGVKSIWVKTHTIHYDTTFGKIGICRWTYIRFASYPGLNQYRWVLKKMIF
jgi:hypothetical protein